MPLLKRLGNISDINSAQLFAGLFPSGQTLAFYVFLSLSINGTNCSLAVIVFLFFARPDLKVILMSATLNSEMFSAYFGRKIMTIKL